MSYLALIPIGFGLLGLLFLVAGFRRLRRRKLLRAGAHGTTGCGMIALGILVASVGLNLQTYRRLTHEQTLAELSFRQTAPERYVALIEYPGSNQARRYELSGDEWQLDARILKWTGLGNIAGLDARYRLERISGRFRSVERERSARHTVYGLADDRGLDLWSVSRRYRRWLPFVDAIYGSAAYLPMADNARYSVSVDQSGLIARPLNRSAREALANWH